jgi:hypothetical protein
VTSTLPSQHTFTVLDDHALPRVENATILTSLTPASAREVRIARIISSQPILVEQARMRGFYDHMFAREFQAAARCRTSRDGREVSAHARR